MENLQKQRLIQVHDAVLDKVAEAAKGQDFEIITTNLSKEDEDKLREAFAH